ncbi:putative cytoplasmic protein [Escherichia coli]|nr:putative cytoplasmic protein [Escherichia coli]
MNGANFQRVYDLTHRVMPDWDDERDLVRKQKQKSSCWITVRVAWEYSANSGWQITIGLKRPALAAWREARAEQQQIIAVHVEKLGNLWLHDDLLPLLERALAGKLTATHSAVLSPFDPVVWDRKRAEQLFDFSYRLECYTQRRNASMAILFCRYYIVGN